MASAGARPTRIHHLPPDLEPLVAESVAEGHDLLQRLRDEWRAGTNRFEREGEAFFALRRDGGLVGVCGLNVDPYAGDPRLGRLRRLYVARAARRTSVGRALVKAALAHAAGRFDAVRLKTLDPGADRFYRALGFARVEGDPHATHALRAPFPLAPPLTVVPFEPRDAAECAAVLEGLPDWFGLPESNARHLRGLAEGPAFVARREGALAGFASLRPGEDGAAEIEVLAVRADLHRRGVGRALVERCEAWLRARGGSALGVKTLGPSRPDPFYARTRAFYQALGFRALEETCGPWGPENPALLLVKRLG